MLENLHYILQHNCILVQNRAILVGVSGGPDSLYLLEMLVDCGYTLLVAHYNHGLRPSADDEARWLAAHVERLGIPFVTAGSDVLAYARDNRQSIEEAARERRYKFLFEEGERIDAQAVAVGHTADDQVETVIMHLLRGAGLQGLRGMEYRSLPNLWSTKLSLIRPLLGVWREQVMSHLAKRGLQPLVDESNLDRTYYRNRIRHELIPLLKEYNPAIREAVYRMSILAQGDYEVIEGVVREASAECNIRTGQGYVSLDYAAWGRQPLAIQRYLLRQAFAALRPGLKDIDFSQVEKAAQHLVAHQSGAVELAADINLLIEGNWVWLFSAGAQLPTDPWPQMRIDEWDEIDIPDKRVLTSGWVFTVEEVQDSRQAFEMAASNKDPFQAWIDLHVPDMPMSLRGRLPGDRIRMIGMQGHSTKVSDLMINLKIPQRVRDSWPLLAAGDDILWIPGLRLSERVQVRGDTQRAAHFQLCRLE